MSKAVGQTPRAHGSTKVATEAVAVGANLVLIASMAWSWTSRGAASAGPGYRLAAQMLSGTFDAFIGRWAGALLLVVPMCGAGALVALASNTKGSRRVRRVLGGVAVVLVGGVLFAIRVKSIDRIGTGAWLAIVGSLASLGTAFAATA